MVCSKFQVSIYMYLLCVVLRVWEWSILTICTHLYNSVQGDDVARVLQTNRLVRSQATVASLRRLQHKARALVQASTCECLKRSPISAHPPEIHPLHASWYSGSSPWFRPVFSPEISFKGVHNEMHSRDCTKQYVAVPGRNWTLFHCVFRPHYRVQSVVAQYFR